MTCSICGAIGGVELLPLTDGVIVGLAGGHSARRGHGPLCLQQQVQRSVDGHIEGILFDRGLEAPRARRVDRREHDGLPGLPG